MTFRGDQDHPTMAERAAAQLHQAIVSGEVPAGAHLRLVDLAERLGMSPMPVREAVRRLESLGLVEVHPHRGAFVRTLSKEDFDDTMETRLLLERAAVEKAAAAFTEEAAEKAEYWLKRYVALAQAGMVVEAREAHTEAHFSIYRASRSKWLMHAIEAVWRNSERYRFTDASGRDEDEVSGHEHSPILEACRAGDPQAAGDALVEHLTRAAGRMVSHIPHQDTGEGEQ